MANPDEVCALCGIARDEHGDAHHEFSVDGSLTPKKKQAPIQATDIPKRASLPQPGITQEMKAKAFTMLLEVLTEKGVIDGKDLIRILA